MASRVALCAAIFLFVSYGNGGSMQAYLDPGTGSFVLQAVLAGFVGALAIGRLYWRRFKSFVLRRDVEDETSATR